MLICSQGVHDLGEVLNLLIIAECVHAACLYAYDGMYYGMYVCI